MSTQKKKRTYRFKNVPNIGGESPHHYPRGYPRSQISVRMPNSAIERIDRICKDYGIQKWAAINMALLAFEHHFEKETEDEGE